MCGHVPGPARAAAVYGDPALPRVKPDKVVVHENKMKGMKAPHLLCELAQQLGLGRTAEAYSALKIYSPRTSAVPVDADVTHLSQALQKYWQMEGIDGGVYPAEATSVAGRVIGLWTFGCRVSFGFAVGSPWRDRKRR